MVQEYQKQRARELIPVLASAWVLPVSVAHLTLTTVSLGAGIPGAEGTEVDGGAERCYPAGNGMLFV